MMLSVSLSLAIIASVVICACAAFAFSIGVLAGRKHTANVCAHALEQLATFHDDAAFHDDGRLLAARILRGVAVRMRDIDFDDEES